MPPLAIAIILQLCENLFCKSSKSILRIFTTIVSTGLRHFGYSFCSIGSEQPMICRCKATLCDRKQGTSFLTCEEMHSTLSVAKDSRAAGSGGLVELLALPEVGPLKISFTPFDGVAPSQCLNTATMPQKAGSLICASFALI